MSMLTGEPRSATVRAARASVLLEVGAERFRQLAVENPGLLDHITEVIAERRAGLDDARAAATATATTHAPGQNSLMARIRDFLRL
jgi:CRP-like cAMP-binding protein